MELKGQTYNILRDQIIMLKMYEVGLKKLKK